ncbi:MAG: RNA methyltransferase [Acidobacteria bacterium]|uniref:tRNA (cytidine/uridine-2'-O-)-methyltransferase TrmJ n=1 Tax=Candidatus Polarisedimenticola svalbardensis TaxID=2886004 RepID=A0A8J6Y9X1_9BACT|nr:RNA methyltransferase [Candidatus Polarisedimenticola svalbardensis]
MNRNVRFVLVSPQSPGNVGATARAMLNFGFQDLRIVEPACDPLAKEARKMAVGARKVLEGAEICDSLDQALQGAGAVIGASRRTGRHRWPHIPIQRLEQELGEAARSSEIAVMFGREDSGLTDLELDRCTHLVHIPTSESYPSVNLAQSVLLVAWELHRAGLPATADEGEPMASDQAREAMYGHLEEALRTIGFLKPDNTEVIMRRLRRMYGRIDMSENEVRIVRGMAHQTLWAAGKAGLIENRDDGTGEA